MHLDLSAAQHAHQAVLLSSAHTWHAPEHSAINVPTRSMQGSQGHNRDNLAAHIPQRSVASALFMSDDSQSGSNSSATARLAGKGVRAGMSLRALVLAWNCMCTFI